MQTINGIDQLMICTKDAVDFLSAHHTTGTNKELFCYYRHAPNELPTDQLRSIMIEFGFIKQDEIRFTLQPLIIGEEDPSCVSEEPARMRASRRGPTGRMIYPATAARKAVHRGVRFIETYDSYNRPVLRDADTAITERFETNWFKPRKSRTPVIYAPATTSFVFLPQRDDPYATVNMIADYCATLLLQRLPFKSD